MIVSTYRLQLGPFFPLSRAKDFLEYFAELGVDALYLSPIFQPKPRSQHGYDVCSYDVINPELGGRGAYLEFTEKAHELGLKQMVDVVVNHMAATPANPWWCDVLKKGEASPFSHYFDINFHPKRRDLQGKILIPILGATLKETIEDGEIQLVQENGNHFIRYEDHYLPASGPFEGSLESVLKRQHYLLTYWQEGPSSVNYRRFFDINELAALRVERDEVFAAAHSLLFELVEQGRIQGLRIDHPDGFLDPKGYFEKLPKDTYVVVEKILESNESLRSDWAVSGTVGYEFLNDLNSVFVQKESEGPFDALTYKFIGKTQDGPSMLYEFKRRFALINMRSEVDSLANGVSVEAICHMCAAFPVYRSYFRKGDAALSRIDRGHFKTAIATVKERAPNVDTSFFAPDQIVNHPDFLLRFQQLTPPIMAKGMEDTFCYNYNRLVSLNEVGGDPMRFGITIEQFHQRNLSRLEEWPHTMTALSTHDTKRSYDTRMRINALSEIPVEWEQMLALWRKQNAPFKTTIKDHLVPEPNLELFFYQNLLGAYPISFERMKNFMYKAMREAKVFTSWIDHNDTYEYAVIRFVEQVLKNSDFLESFLPFHKKISEMGQLKSLAGIALQIGSPGVMDLYQGSEDWDYSLVDPDNRRLVDFERLSKERSVKGQLIEAGLKFRKKYPELILHGTYHPIDLGSDHIAFERRHKKRSLLVVARRFFAKERTLCPFEKEGYDHLLTLHDAPFALMVKENLK